MRLAVAATEADRAGKLLHQDLDFLSGALGPREIVARGGLLDLGAHLPQTFAVRRLCGWIQHRPRVVAGRRRVGLVAAIAPVARGKVERVQLPVRMAQQLGEIREPTAVLQA